MPSCGAASPIPNASCMMLVMRSTWLRSDVVEAIDRSGPALQDRVAESADERHRGRPAGGRLGIEPRLLRLVLDVRHLRLNDLLGHGLDVLSVRTAVGRLTMLLRIDVHGERNAGVRAMAATSSTAARTASIAGARSGERTHELGAVAAAAPEQRRRAEHRHAGRGHALAHRLRRRQLRARAPPTSRPTAPGGRTAGSRRPRGAPARRPRSPSASCSAAWRSARAAGSSACTITRPPRSPRPLRPASWATSANVRSSARKSGKRSVASASSTTASVTSGKSCPLATI